MSHLNYTTYVAELSNTMVVESSDANFQTFVPACIDYAEGRLYRELDLLATVTTDTTNLSSGVRFLGLPTNIGTYLTINNFNIITPVSGSVLTGTRNAAVPVTPDFVDMIYPSATQTTGVPAFYARTNSSTVIVGPAPDRAYLVEIRGTQRPTSLSTGNSSTILTQMLPDLFMAASLVYAFGYMRDFGGQSDNPQAAQSWENQYKTLFQSANAEEVRKKFRGDAWTPEQPSPTASPPRV